MVVAVSCCNRRRRVLSGLVRDHGAERVENRVHGFWSWYRLDWITGMNLFKTFTLKWWQGALFKWGVLAAGMAIGTYWHGFLADYLLLLIIFAFVSLAYITYVWSKQ